MNLVEKSLAFAASAHNGQFRKETKIPFIVHVVEVGNIIREMTQKEGVVNDEALAAGFLHDTVEDTNISLEDLRVNFGEKVAYLVEIQTEDKSKSWQERKDHMIEFLKYNRDETAEVCILADKLANVRALSLEYTELGEDLWSKFNAPKERQFWYYNNIALSMKYVRETTQFIEYEKLIGEIFEK